MAKLMKKCKTCRKKKELFYTADMCEDCYYGLADETFGEKLAAALREAREHQQGKLKLRTTRLKRK